MSTQMQRPERTVVVHGYIFWADTTELAMQSRNELSVARIGQYHITVILLSACEPMAQNTTLWMLGNGGCGFIGDEQAALWRRCYLEICMMLRHILLSDGSSNLRHSTYIGGLLSHTQDSPCKGFQKFQEKKQNKFEILMSAGTSDRY